MSNQNATVNRVTLLESIEAARNSIDLISSFHRVVFGLRDSAKSEIFCHLLAARAELVEAEVYAAELEAWGDGP